MEARTETCKVPRIANSLWSECPVRSRARHSSNPSPTKHSSGAGPCTGGPGSTTLDSRAERVVWRGDLFRQLRSSMIPSQAPPTPSTAPLGMAARVAPPHARWGRHRIASTVPHQCLPRHNVLAIGERLRSQSSVPLQAAPRWSGVIDIAHQARTDRPTDPLQGSTTAHRSTPCWA